MNIGTVDCEASAKLCKEVGYSDDLVYFKGDVGPEKGEVSFPCIVVKNCKFSLMHNLNN